MLHLPERLLARLDLEAVHVADVVEARSRWRRAVARHDPHTGRRRVRTSELVVDRSVRGWQREDRPTVTVGRVGLSSRIADARGSGLVRRAGTEDDERDHIDGVVHAVNLRAPARGWPDDYSHLAMHSVGCSLEWRHPRVRSSCTHAHLSPRASLGHSEIEGDRVLFCLAVERAVVPLRDVISRTQSTPTRAGSACMLRVRGRPDRRTLQSMTRGDAGRRGRSADACSLSRRGGRAPVATADLDAVRGR